MEPFEYAIALTGGAGSGKSSVGSIIKLYGYRVIEADKIAKEQLEANKERVKELFGSEYLIGGEINRRKLRALIFDDSEAKERLEGLLHPLIREEIGRISVALDKKKVPYFVDIPLFFESGDYAIARVLLVYAPRSMQIARICKRDNVSIEEAAKMVEAQMPNEQKREKATYIIENTDNLRHLQQECERVLVEIKKDME